MSVWVPPGTDRLLEIGLAEDLATAGDLTTDAVVPAHLTLSAALVARRDGIVAGLAAAARAWRLVDPRVRVDIVEPDGATVARGATIALVEGPARAILTGERLALNLLGHLSGIATATGALVELVADTGAVVADTRKTTPGLRALEKWAVRLGGGVNHRFGLHDAVLIKDNHIAAVGGIAPAVAAARAAVGHLVPVEVEVDTLAQLDEALAAGVDAVLLDNMDLPRLAEAVTRIDGACIAEASGTITADTIRAVADTGVDVISVGWITHSAPALDVGLDVDSSIA